MSTRIEFRHLKPNKVNMKGFFLFIGVCSALTLVSGDGKSDLVHITQKKIHDECQSDSSTRISNEDLEKANKGEPFDEALMGRHSFCMANKMGVVKANGDLDYDVVKEQLSKVVHRKARLVKAVECVEKKSTPEETSVGFFKCFNEFTGTDSHHHHHH